MEVGYKNYRYLVTCLIIVSLSGIVYGQENFNWTQNTGEYATVGILVDNTILINGKPIASGDEIGVFTPDGLCVGAMRWCGHANHAITVWGDNPVTEEIDGMRQNEKMYYRIWQKETDRVIEVKRVDYALGDELYQSFGIYVVSSLIAYDDVESVVQLEPGHESEYMNTSIQFVWQKDVYASSYSFQVSNTPDFTKSLVYENEVSDTTLTVNDLEHDKNYFWRVGAVDFGGDVVWSQAWSFTTMPALAGSPVLALPNKNAVNISTDTLLVWNEVDGAEKYHVQLSTKSDFSNTVLDKTGLTATNLSVSTLDYGTEYFWRVGADGYCGKKVWSQVWSFTTMPALEGSPVLALPNKNAVNISTDTLLVWNEVDGAEKYHVQLSTKPDFSNTVVDSTGLTVTSLPVNTLDYGTEYFWRVGAVGYCGKKVWSQAWSFTTMPALAGSPVLALPNKNAVNISTDTLLVWNEVDGAEAYHVQLSTKPDFSNTVVDSTGLTVTNLPVSSLNYGAEYFWRVSAVGYCGNQVWSEVWSFTTALYFTDKPIPVLPENGAVSISTDTLLVWNELDGADTYHVQLSKDYDFSTNVIDSTGIVTPELAVSYLEYSTEYFWRFRAVNGEHESDWSAVWSFNTNTITSANGLQQELPVDFSLDQNYPNPFNPTTTIRFALPTESNVRMEIYNMLGQRVTTLVDSEQMRAGIYEKVWDGRDASGMQVSSGTYIYRVVAGDHVETKRMILMK